MRVVAAAADITARLSAAEQMISLQLPSTAACVHALPFCEDVRNSPGVAAGSSCTTTSIQASSLREVLSLMSIGSIGHDM